jgi:hypothetical protein
MLEGKVLMTAPLKRGERKATVFPVPEDEVEFRSPEAKRLR